MNIESFRKLINSLINVGIKSDNINHWSSINMDYFKIYKNLMDNN